MESEDMRDMKSVTIFDIHIFETAIVIVMLFGVSRYLKSQKCLNK